MFTLDFVLEDIELNGRLEEHFAYCQLVLFEEDGNRVRLVLGGQQENWVPFWTAIWQLTECDWFVSTVQLWRFTVDTRAGSYSEDLLEYCRENQKGLFKR